MHRQPLPGLPSESVSLGLKRAGGRQCGSDTFLIHSANFCVFVGKFNPFTFKVLIGKDFEHFALFCVSCAFLVVGLLISSFAAFSHMEMIFLIVRNSDSLLNSVCVCVCVYSRWLPGGLHLTS